MRAPGEGAHARDYSGPCGDLPRWVFCCISSTPSSFPLSCISTVSQSLPSHPTHVIVHTTIWLTSSSSSFQCALYISFLSLQDHTMEIASLHCKHQYNLTRKHILHQLHVAHHSIDNSCDMYASIQLPTHPDSLLLHSLPSAHLPWFWLESQSIQHAGRLQHSIVVLWSSLGGGSHL